jgi:hypothetical protein
MRAIDELLVTGVGVDGGHQSTLDTECIVEHLDHRHETVGRTTGIRHHLMFAAVEILMVDPVDERRIGTG